MKKLLVGLLTLGSLSAFATECFDINVSRDNDWEYGLYTLCAEIEQSGDLIKFSNIRGFEKSPGEVYDRGEFITATYSDAIIPPMNAKFEDEVKLQGKKKFAKKLCATLGDGTLESYTKAWTDKNICRIGSIMGIGCSDSVFKTSYMNTVSCKL